MEMIGKILDGKNKVTVFWKKNKDRILLIMIFAAIFLLIAGTAILTWKLLEKKYKKEALPEDEKTVEDNEDDFLDDAADK